MGRFLTLGETLIGENVRVGDYVVVITEQVEDGTIVEVIRDKGKFLRDNGGGLKLPKDTEIEIIPI